ncbi:MAG: ABC-F family ATP-binding cassette domain-containing protein [Cellulosilyticaceae bacterium]
MILLSASEMSKIYGEKVIFDQISFTINNTDKIGLIGINGTGKTSLLRMIAGLEVPDRGEVITSNELAIEYLPQNPYFDEEATVIEQVFKGTSKFMQVLRDYEKTVLAIEQRPEDTKLQEKLIKLSEEMDLVDAWQVESEAKAILTKLGVTDFSQQVKTMSGGQKKRIALAGALIRPCNLLILDEPTNHLDNDTIDYLEELLKTKKCAVLMVTHDRYFLDRITNRIIELDGGKVYEYEGNYGTFLDLKSQREQARERMEEKQRALYKQELEWMRKGVEARRTKQKARQERFYDLEDNMANRRQDKLEIGLQTSRLGKKIIEIEHVNKAFGDKRVLQDFSYTFVRGDRIGIIGNNGIGKSTLLNMICGHMTPDSGSIAIGDTVKIGYYSQESKDMNESLRVIDYIKEKAEYITVEDGQKVSAGKMLERFLFPAHVQYTPISKLSGGEKRRLYLLSVLMEDINVLLLDEPTNDLDIQTLQILEDYIDTFDGPVVAVSHDRYFLDRVCEKLFVFKGDGDVQYSIGNYTDYVTYRQEEVAQKQKEMVKTKSVDTRVKPQAKLKFSYHEKQEYEKIESVIEALEEKLEQIETEMGKAATNYGKLNELTKEKEEVEEALMEKMERWEYLSELASKIEMQNQ